MDRPADPAGSSGLRTLARRGVRQARRVARWAAAPARRLYRRSDVGRWATEESLHRAWDDRTARLAAMIPPDSQVLELGAGRMVLRQHLPPGCTYVPADLVAREPGVLVCDLNAPRLPALPDVDVVVLGGVLEYVYDVPRLLAHLHARCRLVVASYAPASDGGPPGRASRRMRGWVNDYTADALVGLFLHHGFYPEEEGAWRDQRLYRFRKQHVRPALVRD